MQKPTVGRVVHYRLNDVPLAATVWESGDGMMVNLGFLDENGIAFNATSVCYDDHETTGAPLSDYRWSWPPRV